MPETDYLIKNCTADDFEYACPTLWSELKPSLTAAVRHCDHCNRKVYLCKTDADIKLYTSVNYCIAIADTRPQSEKEWDARFRSTITPAGDATEPAQGVRMIGVMLPAGSERKTVLRLVSGGMRVDEIPDFLHKQPPDNCDDHGGHENP
jgi:hypothetical protein